jgi:hypothetical protein
MELFSVMLRSTELLFTEQHEFKGFLIERGYAGN